MFIGFGISDPKLGKYDTFLRVPKFLCNKGLIKILTDKVFIHYILNPFLVLNFGIFFLDFKRSLMNPSLSLCHKLPFRLQLRLLSLKLGYCFSHSRLWFFHLEGDIEDWYIYFSSDSVKFVR